MGGTDGRPDDQGFVFSALAVAAVDGVGRITGWSPRAAELLGRSAEEVLGRPFRELVADDLSAAGPPAELPDSGQLGLLDAHGDAVAVDLRVVPLGGDPGGHAVLFTPLDTAAEWGYGLALLRALLDQRALGIAVHERDLTIALTNITAGMFGGADLRSGTRLVDVSHVEDAHQVEQVLSRVIATGEPALTEAQRMRSPLMPGREWLVNWSALRLTDADGRPSGVAAIIQDVSDEARTRSHRDLLHQAAARIGFSLDVTQAAQDLADVVADGLADLATVDLTRPILEGEEPVPGAGVTSLSRVATASGIAAWPTGILDTGDPFPDVSLGPELLRVEQGASLVLTREEVVRALGSPWLVRRVVPPEAHSAMVSPLFARGLLLGIVVAWRTTRPHAFDEVDLQVLSEIASRAALGIDNARRYAREHAAAVALQQRLLPRANTDGPAAETVGVYRPAQGGSGVSGDWFDAIGLPSLRVAFVVGDVIGHGLSAAATMGRLRTAVQTYADLELEPGEVLARLEDLVQRLAAEGAHQERDTVGATCLYAVYDPVTRECAVASAGHPPPIVVEPDGTSRIVDVSPAPPLGVGGVPFQSASFTLPPGSVLALYTDGLFAVARYAGADGLDRLRREVAEHCRTHRGLAEIGRAVVAHPGELPARDDIAVLLARTRAVEPRRVFTRQYEARREAVAEARAAAAGQVSRWGYEDLAFTTELVVSELITNAIRYGNGPVTLRLILDRVLICEVGDASSTQPRLLRAADTDEGGRGLFIVAQCTTRWGCRYGRRGKTIWTEQPLTAHDG